MFVYAYSSYLHYNKSNPRLRYAGSSEMKYFNEGDERNILRKNPDENMSYGRVIVSSIACYTCTRVYDFIEAKSCQQEGYIFIYIYRKSINGVSIITYLLLHEGQCIINNNNELRVTGYTIVILIYNATYIITDTLILLRAYKDNSHSLPLHYVCTIQHEIVLTIYI